MDTARIAALLEPFIQYPLSESQLKHISTYIDLLLRWNSRINLTAIRDEEEIVTRHFGESFFMARHLFPSSVADDRVEENEPRSDPLRVLDIGSGAGFPALPLKLWAPQIDLTLIESNHKKAAFLREVIRALALKTVSVISARAEALVQSPTFPRSDLVTLRAVERFESILPEAIAFLSPRGRLALLTTTAQFKHLDMKARTLNWHQPIPIPLSRTRVLCIANSGTS